MSQPKEGRKSLFQANDAARQIQRKRFLVGAKHASNEPENINDHSPANASPLQSIQSNADMRLAEVRPFCDQDDTSRTLIRSAMCQLQLSERAYHRILKLAQTIADLGGSERIQPAHLAEALQYRPRMMEIY
ncbi:MAG: hypothetical protein C3F13_09090 [Anaerolineales bacterium]|nr:hypothetical protein [Anaerolineae bacterium]PWB53555.1 MAG: hypothetical protein C3F13_09090 [Anaerolineales bacterium]